MDTRLMGKCILVTGASSGMGKEVARYLDSLGCWVVLTARRKEKLLSLQEELRGDTAVFSADLQKEEDVEALFGFCREKGIRLDGLVHCAGVNELAPISMMDITEAKRTMDVNFFSFLQLGKHFYSKKNSNAGSSLVAISSIFSLSGQCGNGQYAASKAAVNSAVKTMAQEFLRRKIRVNAILPHYVDTDMMKRAREGGGISEQDPANSLPLGVIDPMEIAYLAEYLLSDCSAKMTGTLIPITSGNGMF